MRRSGRLALAVGLALPSLLAAGVSAASAAGGRTPAVAARSRDTAPTTLRVSIDGIKPVSLTRTSPLIVTGTVTNTATTPVTDGGVSLDFAGAAFSRAELDAFKAAPPLTAPAIARKALPRVLTGAASAPFTLTVPVPGQVFSRLDEAKVLELAVVASGAAATGAAVAPLGVAALPTPYFPDTVQAPLRTAVIIPITAIPDQGPTPLQGAPPAPRSTTLIGELTAPDGRLDKLLSVIAQAPAAGGISSTPMTVAIDPALLTRVCALAGHCGESVPAGTSSGDSAVANAWLTRLSAVVDSPDVTVVGLPYADADVGAMADAGDTKAVIQLLQQAGGLVTAKLNAAATTTDLQPLLPVDGLVDDTLASAAVRAGSTIAVVSPSLFAPVVPATGAPVTPSASTYLTTSSGRLDALVTDDALESLLAPSAATSPRLAEQDLLAELAVITSELPNASARRTVVLAAPRYWNPPAEFATGLVNALGAVRYVTSESLSTIESAPETARTLVKQPPRASPPPLPASSITTIDSERQVVRALHQVAASQPEHLSGPYDEGLDRALSSWWRGPNAAAGGALLTSVSNDLTKLMSGVSIYGGKNGVLLTGPSGILPVQVTNLLNETIAVVVHVKNDGLDQVSGRDQTIHIGPGSEPHQISVPITTRSTRDVTVTMQLLAQSDLSQIAVSPPISVRSSSVGKVAVGITATALTFLVLLIVVRGIRKLAARRRGATTPA